MTLVCLKKVLWQIEHVNYHQSTSKWAWQASPVWTHKQMHTDRQTQMHVRTHTHAHTKNVTMWSSLLQLSAPYNLSGWCRSHRCHKLILSPTLTPCSQTVFFPAIIWNSSFFLLFHSLTICLLHSLSSCLPVHVHFCALPPSYLCGFCLKLCQLSRSCQTIWRALVKQEKWVYWEVQETAGGLTVHLKGC